MSISKNINNIVMVEEDDNLITYVPETPGIDGKTVLGEDIPAKKREEDHHTQRERSRIQRRDKYVFCPPRRSCHIYK